MISFDFDRYCSGCAACYNVCPVNAIDMKKNADGFSVPVVSLEKCIGCGKCNNVCPHINKENVVGTEEDIRGVWLYRSDNDEAKINSASGAAGYELANVMLKQNGYISGCIWNTSLEAQHVVGNTEKILKLTQGSKYVQSRMDDTYKRVVDLIKSGEKVLFTGTPCQATALHNIVSNISGGRYRNSLITVALICHGVASPAIWDSFKKWIARKEGSDLVGINFRDKSQEGYKKSYCRYDFADGKTTYLPTFLPSSKYIEATLVYNLALRKSCGHCDAKGVNNGIDLIIGDWYAEYSGEGKLGTSCIVAFTDRGYTYATENLSGLRSVTFDTVLEKNKYIKYSVNVSDKRELFFENMINDDNYWERVEELYPKKYKLKKILVKTGLYNIVKKIIE